MERGALKKSLGQNFLVDQNIAEKIVRLFGPHENETIIEIGPGEGALTEHLIARRSQVLAIEIDNEAADTIEQRFKNDVTLLRKDFLKTDITEIARELEVEQLRVIGNIPYYITAPILFHLLEHHSVISDAIVMMQREVAERLTAVPRTKEYGILSVQIQTWAKPKRLFNVPPSCFFPRPKVTSTVVSLKFEERSELGGIEEEHQQLVRAAFGKRRKRLKNALKELITNRDERAELFTKAEIDPQRRAEELTPEEFIRFARLFAAASSGNAG
ncbi:MAG: ribosomal RNA small subunit methyltransferase A [Chlorobi bacterium]|nr:ribosomal RNA small subunit methyltransferase A [Chlorobiota bacterium]